MLAQKINELKKKEIQFCFLFHEKLLELLEDEWFLYLLRKQLRDQLRGAEIGMMMIEKYSDSYFSRTYSLRDQLKVLYRAIKDKELDALTDIEEYRRRCLEI